MKHLFPVVTIIGGLIGVLLLFISFAMDSAPQQGALAATAVGFAVIPYCITKAIQLLTDESEDILRSIVSEIRRGFLESQQDGSPGSQRETPQRTMVNPDDGITKRETITHPAKR